MRSPFPLGDATPLQELMKRTGITAKELALLKESQNNSDQLVEMEEVAMNLLKKGNKDSSDVTVPDITDQKKAMDILFGDQYHQAKIKIMQPINKFLEELDNRTHKAVVHQAVILKVSYFALATTFTLILFAIVFLMRTEKQNFGYKLTFKGFIRKDEMLEWVEESKNLYRSTQGVWGSR